LVAILSLGACGGTSDDSTDDAGPTPSSAAADAGADPTTPADEPAIEPLGEVTVVRDPASTESVIGIDGGTVSAIGADGATYELVVPPGSLAADTTIVMTPARLDGVPFPTSTVMFEPAGLEFIDPASLTITPTAEVPLDTRLLYELDDDATVFAAAFPGDDGTGNTILVSHFSGYGVADATGPERAALLEKGADDASAAVQSALAEAMQNLPRHSEGNVSRAELEALIDEASAIWENEVIAPRLEAASASCEAASTAVSVNLTAANPTKRGFLALFPCGVAVPAASTLDHQPDVNGAFST
jgi:hypothetical protein